MNNSSSTCRSTTITSTSTADQQEDIYWREKRLKLLDGIASVQRQYLQSADARQVFGSLLENLLELTDSEYGFIGEVKHDVVDGARTPYLQTHAITNIAWDAVTRQFYDDNVNSGLKFCNLQSLFGEVITTAKPMCVNRPSEHPKACGIPEGHPPLDHFLGIPFFQEVADSNNSTSEEEGGAGGTKTVMNGMVGIANKPGGYCQADIDFLEPFTVTCSNLIQAYDAIRKNKELLNNLEEKVQERTAELQQANVRLEEANKRVLRASQQQLQLFACASHEIRTPLNCIIGLSSLLQETELNPYQQDCMKMIVSSGDLLLTVVNDVLDYSKLESGNVDITMKPSNLQSCMDAVVHSMSQKAKSKDIEIATTYGQNVPEIVTTDNRRLQQILYNLLGNAIKFSNPKSTVELSMQVLDNTSENQLQEYWVDDSRIVPESGLDQQQPRPKKNKYNNIQTASSSTAAASTCSLRATNSAAPSEDVIMADATTTTASKSLCPFAGRSATLTSQQEQQQHKRQTGARMGGSSDNSNYTRQRVAVRKHCSLPSLETSPRILRFSVKDHGLGIQRKDFQRIFKPFKQANSHTETFYGGTGLGLAITTKLVKGLGGAISVDSVFGKWTEFTVDLPINEETFDIEMLSQKLKHAATVLTVNKNPDDDVASIFKQHSIDCRPFENMEDILTAVQSPCAFNPERVFVVIVDEALYSAELYRKFSEELIDTRTILLTHGLNYSISETNLHFRSIRQVLPSAFMGSLVSQIENSLQRENGTRPRMAEVAVKRISFDQLRILIAEDNVINQKVLARMLCRLGVVDVDVALNGEIAVSKSAEKKYDIIFMDMQMPVMDGCEATQQIVRRRGSNSLPKVIFVTANVSEAFEEEASAAGGDGFISKPFGLGMIEKALSIL